MGRNELGQHFGHRASSLVTIVNACWGGGNFAATSEVSVFFSQSSMAAEATYGSLDTSALLKESICGGVLGQISFRIRSFWGCILDLPGVRFGIPSLRIYSTKVKRSRILRILVEGYSILVEGYYLESDTPCTHKGWAVGGLWKLPPDLPPCFRKPSAPGDLK